MCPICIEEEKLKIKLQQINSNNRKNNSIINQLQTEINFYKQHLYFKTKQQEFYKNSLNLITNILCVIVMDFKENFKIGGGPIKTGKNFYKKIQISLLDLLFFIKIIII